jgi:phage terminase large subunit-like protein
VFKAAGVTWENVYIDGNYFASTPPMTFNWNSATVANGSHTILVTGFAANSTVLGSASITVTVANSGATPTATTIATPTATGVGTSTPTAVPTPGVVQITTPANGASVKGTAVTITVTKAASATWLDVYIDGAYFASTPPMTFSWNSTTVPDGAHTISATAFAANSTVLGSTSITVNVTN